MTTIIFFASLAIVIFMMILKSLELKFGEFRMFTFIRSVGDKTVNNLINYSIFKYNRWKKISNIFMFEFIPSLVYEMLVKMKDYVSKKYYSHGDRFRGRRMLRTDGSVSFFLDRLSDEKTGSSRSNI